MALNFQNNGPTRTGWAPIALALVLSLACVGVYSAEGDGGPLHRIQAVVEGAIVPLQLAGSPLGAAADEAQQTAGDSDASEETLSALRDANEQMTQTFVQGEEYRLQAQRLMALLNLRDAYEIEGPTGRVIGRSTDAWNQDVTLDVGSNQGVESGLTVVGPTGVVGQVISVSGNSCRVRLLTDPQSGAAAMIQSSRAEGIVRGSLDGLLYLENISADVNVQVGDVVLTSGLGGSYTRGLLIGTVARVEGSAGNASRRIVVAPNGSVSLMEEAMVVFSAASDAVDRSAPSVPAAEDGGQEADDSGDSGDSGEGASEDDGSEGASSDQASSDASDERSDNEGGDE